MDLQRGLRRRSSRPLTEIGSRLLLPFRHPLDIQITWRDHFGIRTQAMRQPSMKIGKDFWPDLFIIRDGQGASIKV